MGKEKAGREGVSERAPPWVRDFTPATKWPGQSVHRDSGPCAVVRTWAFPGQQSCSVCGRLIRRAPNVTDEGEGSVFASINGHVAGNPVLTH